jgi:regulatory protein YycH of two-component signal transduction system YycFG
MTNLELILLVSLIVIIPIFSFIISNLLKKYEKLENEVENSVKIVNEYNEYLNELSKTIKLADIRLEEIDSKGTFKSDDEIGFFFTEVKDLQNILNQFIIKDGKEEERK